MFKHITVLKQEAVDGLQIRPDGIYVDCTLVELVILSSLCKS